MLKWKILRITAILIGCGCILLVLAAPLPGEVEGCDGEKTTEEVDYIWYCVEYCTIHAYKEASDCDIFDGLYTEDYLRDLCISSHNCSTHDQNYCNPRCDPVLPDPSMCPEGEHWHPFISVSEAEDCLSALMNLSCDDWGTDPWKCRSEALCDPE